MLSQRQDLAGRTILVTRAENQSAETGQTIERRGGNPLYLPCLELECLQEDIRASVPMLQESKSTVLFTSVNGVRCVAETFGSAFALLMKPHRLIAVGEKTAEALSGCGIDIDTVPEEASQAGVIELLKRTGTPGQLLFFRAEEGSDAVAKWLAVAGSKVKTVHAYRMRCPDADASEIISSMAQGEIDGVLLGSSRTAANYIRRIGNIETANNPAIAVISPQVAAFAEKEGLRVQVVAKRASFDAMLDALSEYLNHGV